MSNGGFIPDKGQQALAMAQGLEANFESLQDTLDQMGILMDEMLARIEALERKVS